MLHAFNKTYLKRTAVERELSSDEFSPVPQLEKRNPGRPNVTITLDSVDTGERRQTGPFQAHRVLTTIVVQPGKRATTKPAEIDIDGWYVDLRGLTCFEREQQLPPGVGRLALEAVRNNDHPVLKIVSNALRGFAVEEKSIEKRDENTVVNRVELVEISELPLEPSLFEPPPDYTQATPQQHPAGEWIRPGSHRLAPQTGSAGAATPQ